MLINVSNLTPIFLVPGTSREMLDAELVVLDPETSSHPQAPYSGATSNGNGNGNGNGTKARSLSNLSSGLKLSLAPADPSLTHEIDGLNELLNDVDERAKSLEFLLDENQKNFSLVSGNGKSFSL